MPDPVYDASKIIGKKGVSSDLSVPSYNPNKIVKKGFIDSPETKMVMSKGFEPGVPAEDIKKRQIDESLEFIQANSRRYMRDDEKNILRDMMVNPNTSKEELSDAIVTLQGGKSKQADNTISTPDYYMSLNEKSGNYVPIALGVGEKIPAGKRAASLWGTQESANDDNALTDMSKSVANGAIKAVGGIIDVLQTGTEIVTGSESESFRAAQNSMQAMEFNKDKALSENPLFKTEGIETFSDIFDASRVDLGPKALWGAFNGLTESLVEFGIGTRSGVSFIKGGKALKYGLKGVDTALDLGKGAQKAAIFTGSYITQLGENLDRADEAGLTGRDRSAVASLVTVPMAALDAFWGLDGKIMSSLFNKSKNEILKNVIKSAERDEFGNITQNGFKQLTKEMSAQYGQLAKNGAKEIIKDAFPEGFQEAAQDFSQKAGEQLWDKMSDDDKAKYGTDAFSAKSFGSYVNSFSTGLVSGVPMSVASNILKSRHDDQSANAYTTVKEGPKAINALKTDLNNALEKNEITPEEHAEANFKIDSYNAYHEQTKGVNLKPEEEKKAFELSFQIQGLKTEIPTNENEISKLDPISRAKVESKQKQAKELQSELNEIVLKGEVKGEPIVSKKTEEKLDKDREEDVAESIAENKSKIKPITSKAIAPKFEVHEAPENQPEYTKDKRSYDEVPAEEFNNHFTNARTIHRVLRKKLANLPNKEMTGKLIAHEYSYVKNNKVHNNRTIKVALEDGRVIKLASSKIREDSLLSGHTQTENIKEISTNENYRGEVPPVTVGVKVLDLSDVPAEYLDKMPKGYRSGKKVIKVYNKENGKFISWVKETNSGNLNAKDKGGKALYTEDEIDLMGHLKTINEDVNPEEFEAARNKPISPIVVKTPKQRGKEALEGIAGEGKKKVAESKIDNTVIDFGKDTELKINKFTSDKNTKVINLEDIINEDKNDATKKLFQLLKPYLKKTAKIYYQDGYVFNGGSELAAETGYAATIDGKGNVFIFNKNNLDSETIIHELLHDLMFDAININKDQGLINDLTVLFEKAKNSSDKTFKERYSYAFNNLDEFISEAFGNEAFRQELSYIKSDSFNKNGNIFASISEIIKNYLKEKFGFEISNTLLDDIFNAVEHTIKNKYNAEKESSVKNKFAKSVELYYEATESEGSTKKRSKAKERKLFLEKNPSIKYIDDNMKYIYTQLESKNLLTKKGNCP
jgi:hypothetical protein